MATEAAPLTHCPNCGAKLARPELSLCAYCASPLRMGAAAPATDDETTRALNKLKSHADFPGAIALTPIEPEIESRASRLESIGTVLLIAAGLLGIAQWVWGGPVSITKPLLVSAVAVALCGFALFATAKRTRATAKARALLRRASRVTDRRSEMREGGRLGTCIYYFMLRFDDGSEGEFSFVGRGTLYEPPAIGATGVAYTHGAKLIDFRRL